MGDDLHAGGVGLARQGQGFGHGQAAQAVRAGGVGVAAAQPGRARAERAVQKQLERADLPAFAVRAGAIPGVPQRLQVCGRVHRALQRQAQRQRVLCVQFTLR